MQGKFPQNDREYPLADLIIQIILHLAHQFCGPPNPTPHLVLLIVGIRTDPANNIFASILPVAFRNEYGETSSKWNLLLHVVLFTVRYHVNVAVSGRSGMECNFVALAPPGMGNALEGIPHQKNRLESNAKTPVGT